MSAVAILSSSERDRREGQASSSFHQTVRQRLTCRLRSFHSIDTTEAAVAILRSPSSGPDQCEWAERFLCGMIQGDAATFMEHRQSQS